MDEGKSKKEENKKERRFDPELLKEGLRCDLDQYDMLERCSEKKDTTEWNEWRKKSVGEVMFLEGASFFRVDLENKTTKGLYLEGANLIGAELEKAVFLETNLRNADLSGAHLRGAISYKLDLAGSLLETADLQDIKLEKADLRGMQCNNAVVNGATLLYLCEIDPKTDFRGVGLDSATIDDGTKQLLKYNIRRMNWEEWYKEHWFWRWPVRAFWAMSDYGRSTLRVIGVFFILAFLFAAVYANWAYWAPPGIVNDLSVEVHEPIWHYFVLSVARPVYFSIVTMTTLGFGDMYANKGSILGHVLLILQVILGYVLLGALVTRFAVLFTAGGPAGKFAEEKVKNAQNKFGGPH